MKMDSESIKIVAIFTVMSFVVSALLYLAINSWRGCRRDKKKAEEILSWPTTTASAKDWEAIEGAGFRGKYRHYKPNIRYSYYLDGKAYFINVGDKKFYFSEFTENSHESRLKAKRDAEELGKSIVEEGKSIQIYYNPNDPSESVAEITESSCASIFVVVVVLSIILLISTSIALFFLAVIVVPFFRR